MIRVVKPKKDYICSFCGSGPAKMLIVYVDPNRAASIPTCEVCYEELKLEMADKPAPKKRATKKADIE